MKLDDGRLTFVAQQEVTALDAIHKAALGKAACAGRVTEGVGTCISIHAPTWGATLAQREALTKLLFQSTHPRGVRHKGATRADTKPDNFNPRTHVGCDREPFAVLAHISYFNPRTHVGCDAGARPCVCFQNDFNPRTHVGCDVVIGVELISIAQFQSTHPRGVRRTTG